MLQFVSNQVGEFPDLLEDQMTSAGSVQCASSGSAAQPAIQTPQAPQTPTAAVYQSATPTLSTQSLPLTPPLTPAQTPSPTATTAVSGQQLVTRTPPLLQPRPQMVQAIQPQPQQTAQPAIQVPTGCLSDTCT